MDMLSHLTSISVAVLLAAISGQVSTYKSKNYVINYILVDNESGITTAIPLHNDLGITINKTANNEHVPEVERAGRTLKERVRAV